jgi:hypothetical protein
MEGEGQHEKWREIEKRNRGREREIDRKRNGER